MYNKVKIPILRKTIPELFRFLPCDEQKHNGEFVE